MLLIEVIDRGFWATARTIEAILDRLTKQWAQYRSDFWVEKGS